MKITNSQRIKVAIVIDNFCVGGAEKQLTELMPLLDKNIIDLSFITLSQIPGKVVLYDKLPSWLPVYKLNFHGFKDISSWVEFYKTLRSIKPDVVIPNLFFSNTIVRILKLFTGYMVIPIEHNTYVDKTWAKKTLDRWLAKLSYRIIAVSNTVADFTIKQERIPKNKFVVIKNGVDIEKIQSALTALPSKDMLRQELGFKTSDKVLLNVAGLKPKKNHTLMLEGFARFHEKHPEYKLAIAGEGGMRKKLEARVQELGLDGAVTFFGLRRDIEKFYKMSDVFVSTSDIEGLSIAYLEALASGLPLVSTKTAGTDELLVDGENGFFIPESSADVVVESLEKMARADYEKISENARKTAAEFDIRKTAEKYSMLIAKAYKKKFSPKETVYDMNLIHKLFDLVLKIGSNPIAFTRYIVRHMKQYRTNDLLRFANKVETDKGVGFHNYIRVYDHFLKARRPEEFTLCEVGLLQDRFQISPKEIRNRKGKSEESYSTAPSLNMWREYLPNATIIGFDISTFTQPKDKKSFIVQGDQSSRDDLKKILQVKKELDVVIEDALHASPHQQITLSYLFPHLTSGGLFFMEDLRYQPKGFERSDVPTTLELLKKLKTTGVWESPLSTPEEKNVLETQIKEIHFFESWKATNPIRGKDAIAVIIKK